MRNLPACRIPAALDPPSAPSAYRPARTVPPWVASLALLEKGLPSWPVAVALADWEGRKLRRRRAPGVRLLCTPGVAVEGESVAIAVGSGWMRAGRRNRFCRAQRPASARRARWVLRNGKGRAGSSAP